MVMVVAPASRRLMAGLSSPLATGTPVDRNGSGSSGPGDWGDCGAGNARGDDCGVIGGGGIKGPD